MDFEVLATAVAMVAIGLAFPVMGWLAALGMLVLLAGLVNLLSVLWPFLLLGLVLLAVTVVAMIWIANLRERGGSMTRADHARLKESLKQSLPKRRQS